MLAKSAVSTVLYHYISSNRPQTRAHVQLYLHGKYNPAAAITACCLCQVAVSNQQEEAAAAGVMT